jgi:hypothetical protein
MRLNLFYFFTFGNQNASLRMIYDTAEIYFFSNLIIKWNILYIFTFLKFGKDPTHCKVQRCNTVNTADLLQFFLTIYKAE